MPESQEPRPSKLDDASWHYGGKFPKKLPPEAGGTHIGMFFAWAATRAMVVPLEGEPMYLLLSRKVAPGAYFMEERDGKLMLDDFVPSAQDFVAKYYSIHEVYLDDYVETFQEVKETYAVPDTWESFDRLAPVLDRRREEWQRFVAGEQA